MTRRLVFGEQPGSTGERRTSHWSERGDSMAVRLRFPLLLLMQLRKVEKEGEVTGASSRVG